MTTHAHLFCICLFRVCVAVSHSNTTVLGVRFPEIQRSLSMRALCELAVFKIHPSLDRIGDTDPWMVRICKNTSEYLKYENRGKCRGLLALCTFPGYLDISRFSLFFVLTPALLLYLRLCIAIPDVHCQRH